jgi:c-di-GMP-related signal transduction protein
VKGPCSFVASQPILDSQQQVVAYELLFRNSRGAAEPISDGLVATLAVMQAALADFCLDSMAEGTKCFLNCTAELLNSGMVSLLGPDRFVLEVLETCALTPQLSATCKQLRHDGYVIALDDVCSYSWELQDFLSAVDIIKIDWRHAAGPERQWLSRKLSSGGAMVLAEKVEDWAAFCDARAAGATLFQGYFFSKPEILRTRRITPYMHAILSVMQLIADDAPWQFISSAVEGLQFYWLTFYA